MLQLLHSRLLWNYRNCKWYLQADKMHRFQHETDTRSGKKLRCPLPTPPQISHPKNSDSASEIHTHCIRPMGGNAKAMKNRHTIVLCLFRNNFFFKQQQTYHSMYITGFSVVMSQILMVPSKLAVANASGLSGWNWQSKIVSMWPWYR